MPRSTALFGALCLVAGWLMASVIPPPVASLQSNPPAPARPAPPPAASAAPRPTTYTERLRKKMRDAPGAPVARRNPFAFESRPREAAPIPATEPATTIEETPVLPRFELAGIAADDTPDGLSRTAIISTSGDVVLAHVGDVLSDGSRVIAIDDISVTLDAGGETRILRLKP